MNSQSPQTKQTNQDKADKLARTAKNVGIGVLAVGATFFVTRKIVKEAKKNRSETKFTTEAQQAVALRGAMNRSGMNWLHWIDGTNTDALYNLAHEIRDIKKVAKEYKNLYNRVLVEDLRKELKPGELEKFNTLLNKKAFLDTQSHSLDTRPTKETNNYEGKGRIVLIEKPVRIFKSLSWLPFGTIKKASSKSYIPYPTVKTVEKKVSAFQSLKFYEVLVKTQESKVKTIYVQAEGTRLIQVDDLINYNRQYSPISFNNKDFD